MSESFGLGYENKVDEVFSSENSSNSLEVNKSTSDVVLSVITEQLTNLHLPEGVRLKWQDLLNSMRIVDDYIDTQDNNIARQEIIEQVSDSLDGKMVEMSPNLQKAMIVVNHLAQELGDSQKKFLINSLKRILKITEEIKNETNPKDFADMTRLEGQVTAKIFLQFLPEEFRSSPNYGKLVKIFSRLGRAANTFDTFVDLPRDYKAGQTKVLPTPLNQLILFGAVISDGISFLKNVKFSSPMASGLLKTSKKVVKNTFNKKF